MTTDAETGADTGAHAGAPPSRVAVLGACVSRDVFNSRFSPDYRSRYQVVASSFRASLISVMSAPIPAAEEGLESLVEGSRRMFLRDLKKPFPAELAASPPDLLVVDWAADVRLGTAVLDDGRVLTWNRNHMRHARGFGAWLAAEGITVRKIRPDRAADRAEYVERFTDALVRLQAHLRAVAPDTQVVLVRAHVTKELWLPGRSQPVPLAAHRRTPSSNPDRTNEAWDVLDELTMTHTDWRAVDLRAGRYPTSDTHPWGAGGLHYAPEYYRDLLAAIDRIAADRRAGVPDPVRTIEGSPPSVIGRSWDGEPGAGPARPRLPRRPRGSRLGGLGRLVRPIRAVRARVRSFRVRLRR